MAKYLKNNIRTYRENFGYTQVKLGELIGCNVSQISRYELGEQVPPMDKAIAMADLFHTTVDELIATRGPRERKLTEEGLEILDISRAQVVRRQFFSRVNDKAVTIYPDGIRFSTACVRTWEETDYIYITVDEEQNLLIIRKSSIDERDSQKWSKLEDERVVSRKITGRKFSAFLYEFMNWSRGYMYKISGFQAVNQADMSEPLWFFELEDAEAHPMSEKSRVKAGVRNEDIDSQVLEVLQEVERRRADERVERERLRQEGKDPGPMQQYVISPDRWGQYTFGLPVEEHDNIPKVSIKT